MAQDVVPHLREVTTDALRYWELSRGVWRRVLLVVGFAFAATLTHFFASGMFTGRGGVA